MRTALIGRAPTTQYELPHARFARRNSKFARGLGIDGMIVRLRYRRRRVREAGEMHDGVHAVNERAGIKIFGEIWEHDGFNAGNGLS